MDDLQVVHVREVLPLRDLHVQRVLQVQGPFTSVSQVTVNGATTKFVELADGSLLVPSAGGQVRVVHAPAGVTTVVLVDPGKVLGSAFVLRATVDDTSKVVEVRVNNKSAPFTVLTATVLACELPKDAKTLEALDVVVTAPAVSRETFFEHVLPVHSRKVNGPQKLVCQLVKLLMTTPGTDVLHPQEGGGMQQLVGTPLRADEPAAITALVTNAVTRAVGQLVQAQGSSRLPLSERIGSAKVTNVYVPPEDPTAVSLSLVLTTLDKSSAVFGVLLAQG